MPPVRPHEEDALPPGARAALEAALTDALQAPIESLTGIFEHALERCFADGTSSSARTAAERYAEQCKLRVVCAMASDHGLAEAQFETVRARGYNDMSEETSTELCMAKHRADRGDLEGTRGIFDRLEARLRAFPSPDPTYFDYVRELRVRFLESADACDR